MNKPLFYFSKNTSRKKMDLKTVQCCLSFLFIGLLTQNISSSEPDPYLWLEEVEGQASLTWVEEQNQETFSRYTQSNEFNEQYQKIKTELNDEERIPRRLLSEWRDV